LGRRIASVGSFARTNLPNGVTTTAYNANNQLATWGTANLFYDANGNMTSDGIHSFTWDARNRLTQIDSGSTASFGYDLSGRRSSKSILGTMTSFAYDRANVVQELIGGTNTANSLTGGVDEVFQRTDSAGARGFLADGLGNMLALADGTGTIQTSYTFDAFGNTSSTGTASTNSFAYAGRELDATGLYFNRARYYNPSLQRFISEDPLGLGGGDVNLYAYVANAPMDFTDPFGLAWVYHQSTGQMFYLDDNTGVSTLVGAGYSGHGNGLNGHDFQNVPGDPRNPQNTSAGPLPVGDYGIGIQRDNVTRTGTRLPGSMRLSPKAGNQMFGRKGFLIHGGRRDGSQTASQGCIVLPRDVRDLIGSSGDNALEVVP
jgi:RHS repeat-associated protein